MPPTTVGPKCDQGNCGSRADDCQSVARQEPEGNRVNVTIGKASFLILSLTRYF